ncbi:MAG: amino acid adenylation domain-containing protein, partial [Acidobacteria bacterium]|nr:amino acid adenylation domain-containing protein [Acidobacteriota bacterium]
MQFAIEILADLESFIRPFDLSQAPLLRVGLIRKAHDRHIVVIDIHHIAADGTSLGILYKDMMDIYQGKELTPLETTYKDYAAWQNNPQNRDILKLQEKSWLERFAGEIPVLNLPTDFPRPPVQDFTGNQIEFELETAETSFLKKFAQDHDATLFIVLLAACNIWFSKLSGEEDIVIGSPTAARRHAEVQNIAGMFVNTLPLRNYPVPNQTFTAFSQDVKERAWQAFQDQDYPFEELVEKIVVKRDTSRNPLFDVMFSFQNMDIPVINIPSLILRPYKLEIKTAKFDLNLSGREQEGRIIFNLEYAAKLFKEESIHKFIDYFRNIINAIIADPAVKIADIPIISEEDKEKILALSAGPSALIDFNETIHSWFEKVVLKNEYKTALVFKNSRITYTELNRRANNLARLLREKGIGPDKVVGLMVERSLEMVIGMLAVMKAGGAYLPIDPKLPAQRKQIMIEDGSISLLLTNNDIEKDTCWTDSPPGNLPITTKGQNLVYVLFTSGSTGKPKGVMLQHSNLVNLMQFQLGYTNIDSSKVLQFTTISFDVSFQEIFSTLLSGGELYLISEETRGNIPDLFQVISRHQIKTLFLPMSVLKLIFSQDDYIDIFPGSVEHIVTAGEQVVVDDRLRNYLKQHHIYLHNHYGPAETHVVTTLTFHPDAYIPEFPAIGRPISNTRIYILDKNKHFQPVGIAGELYAAGFQVGRGYIGKETETGEKFIDDIFTPGKMYRTGDLARWLPDGPPAGGGSGGVIEFLGRSDHQVKIRGIRVEPGEIETRLKKVSFVKDAVVVVIQQQASNDKYLCAYVVINAEETKIGDLRNLLSVDLPDYMIPAYFIPVAKIPLTPSGKVDRRALPEPELKTSTAYAAPRDEIEIKLVDLWAEILNKKSLSIDDNFFQVGGHSLKATLMVSRIHKEFNVKPKLVDIFKWPTIRELATYIRNMGECTFISLKPAPPGEYYILSSPQRRLYILQQMEKNSTAYNLPAVLELEGTPEIEKITAIFAKLISRHESFRTSFHMMDQLVVQKIHPAGEIEFSLSYGEVPADADPLYISQMTSIFIQGFNLSTAPLLRVRLLKLREQKHILMLDMHHIISDGTSLGILVKEFMALYSGIELSPLTIQYKDYAVYQGSQEGMNVTQQQAEYWLNEYREAPPVLDLPLDYPRPAVQSFAGTSLGFELESHEYEKLVPLTREENVTLYMVLLAAYSLLLSRLSGQEEIVIGAPVAGRRHVELTSIIGMFVNTLALHFYPTGHKTFREFLTELKIKTLEAFENQEYPFEDLVERVVLNRDTGRNPLFDVVFLLQNQDVPTLEIPGLKLKPYPFETKIAKFDLTLAASERQNESGEKTVRFEWEYCTQLFNENTISRFIVYFKKILNTVIENRDIQLGNLEIITETEKHQIIYEFNNTGADYPRDKTIQQLFTGQVAQTPDYIALHGCMDAWMDGEVETLRATSLQYQYQITYHQLNEQSNRLAVSLIEKGVLPDDIVAIMMKRSIDLITAILGVLNAGGAYLPIDPEYPQERIDYMLKDSGTRILITNNGNKKTGNYQCSIVNCQLSMSGCPRRGLHHSAFSIQHSNLAYIIYTSGSTGRPKGVLVEQHSVVNILFSLFEKYPLHRQDCYLLKTTYVFDVSVSELFGWFLGGGKLAILPPGSEKEPAQIIQAV